jgi:XTP/dITP diphosphohydrolase
VRLLSPCDFKGVPDAEETGSSYEENALLKARAWARRTGIPSIADDSGLEVRALGWRPGIYSARAGENDSDRINWLLGELSGRDDRRARFVACLVIAFPFERSVRRDYFASSGVCWGNISSPRGKSGFGYDPIFVPDGYGATFAELGPSVKSEISHRASAMRGVAQIINSVVKYDAVYRGTLRESSD